MVSKSTQATAWSFLSQAISKVIGPITNIVLARLLAPEVFGITASISMVTSFADTISEGGFSKYIISKQYDDNEELNKDANVAFWTNFFISCILWLLIIIFRKQLCLLLGEEDLVLPLVVASFQIVLSSFSCIQSGLIQKGYGFKSLFFVRMTLSIIHLFVTIIFAICGFEHWSIIFGGFINSILSIIALSLKSKWMPRFYYSFKKLKEIFSFSMWILIESIAVWLTSWFDSFIIGNSFSKTDLGIYKNSQSVVNGMLSIPQNAVSSVLLVSLSEKRNDDVAFKKEFLKFQRLLAFLLVPMSFGIFLYRDVAEKIVFGDGWDNAGFVIALWSIASVFRILFVSMNTSAYIAKGKPQYSLICQIIDIFILIPSCLLSCKYDIKTFVIIRCIVRLDIIIPSLFFIHKLCKIKLIDVIGNMFKPLIASFAMACFALLMQSISSSIIWSFASMLACAVVYFLIMIFIAKDDFSEIIVIVKRKLKKDKQ